MERALPARGKKTLGERIAKDFKSNAVVYLIFLPIFAYFIIFNYVPLFGLTMAFQNYDIGKGIFGSSFVGMKQFQDFFSDPYCGRLIRNTLIFSGLSILFTFPAAILFALLTNAIHVKWFRRLLSTCAYMPFFISTVVVAGMISEFLEPTGFIGSFLIRIGVVGEGEYVLADPKAFRAIIIISDIWQTTGFSSIVYVAALSSIDKTLYEAADIDGAGRWRKLWNITIPGIMPVIVMMLVLKVGTLLNVGAEKILLLYSPTTYEVGDVLSTYVYRLGLAEGSQYSYTTAIGLFNSVCNLVLLAVSNFLSKKLTSYGLA